ncbi:unnamed protein product [Adineta ricciae]|uniref:Uncharacterized protein n=1 Tax=Adineta ricciae TaxID=249248 RepID=A0A814UBM2_ADIRI|nr:unnamed protein product [Adineta ricciae]
MMQPATILHYENETGNHRKKVDWFNRGTPIEEFYQRITDEMGMRSFKLEINDPHDGFVDFDEGYRKSFRPYATNPETRNAGPQSTNVPVQVVELKIVNISSKNYFLKLMIFTYVRIGARRKSNKKSSNIVRQLAEPDLVTAQPEIEQEGASSQTGSPFVCAPSPVMLNKKEPAIEFITDVNSTLRCPYESEKPIMIQGDKTGLIESARHASVLPKFKIRKDAVSEKNKSTCSVVNVLVEEVCKDGRRTFYHHSEQEVFTDENESVSAITCNKCGSLKKRNEARQGFVVTPFDDEMQSEKGYKIAWKAKRIADTGVHTKNHLDRHKHVFCSLENQYPKGTNYETTRLAVLLEQNGCLLWNTLVLSKAFTFCKSPKNVDYIIVKDHHGNIIEQIPKEKKERKKNSKRSATVTNTSKSKKFKPSNTQASSVTTTMNYIQQHGDSLSANSMVFNTTYAAPMQFIIDFR